MLLIPSMTPPPPFERRSLVDLKTTVQQQQQAIAILPPSQDGIAEYTHLDVLNGRGGSTNHHPGNRYYRNLIKEYRNLYERVNKIQKPDVAVQIVQAIRRRGGRFLSAKSKETGLYHEIGDVAAREKTCQCLRHATYHMRREAAVQRSKAARRKQQQQAQAAASAPSDGESTTLQEEAEDEKVVAAKEDNIKEDPQQQTASSSPAAAPVLSLSVLPSFAPREGDMAAAAVLRSSNSSHPTTSASSLLYSDPHRLAALLGTANSSPNPLLLSPFLGGATTAYPFLDLAYPSSLALWRLQQEQQQIAVARHLALLQQQQQHQHAWPAMVSASSLGGHSNGAEHGDEKEDGPQR